MRKKRISILIDVVLIIIAFYGGRYVERRENKLARIKQCDTLITLAIDKVENEDLSDETTMKAFISDIYTAYKICDDPYVRDTLDEIWNTLLFDSDAYNGKEDVLIKQLSGAYQVKK